MFPESHSVGSCGFRASGWLSAFVVGRAVTGKKMRLETTQAKTNEQNGQNSRKRQRAALSLSHESRGEMGRQFLHRSGFETLGERGAPAVLWEMGVCPVA